MAEGSPAGRPDLSLLAAGTSPQRLCIEGRDGTGGDFNMANIAEGFKRGRLSEFHQFLSVSKASCAELRSHLYVALNAGYLTAEEFEAIRLKADEVGKILGGL